MRAKAVIGEIPVTCQLGVAALIGGIPMSLSSLPRESIHNSMSKVVKRANEYTGTGASSTCHQHVLFVNFHYRANSMRENRYMC